MNAAVARFPSPRARGHSHSRVVSAAALDRRSHPRQIALSRGGHVRRVRNLEHDSLHLAALNSKFPDSHKKTADKIAVKMLQCLNPPRQGMATLGTMALVELRKADKFFINGHRSAKAMRDAWESIWRTNFAQSSSGPRGQQGDGAFYTGECGNCDKAFYARPQAAPSRCFTVDKMVKKGIKRCYNCQGWDHTSAECTTKSQEAHRPPRRGHAPQQGCH